MVNAQNASEHSIGPATISRDELKSVLDQGREVKLVMVLGEWAFRALRIPGSLHFNSVDEALHALRRDESIVLYCSHDDCPASKHAYRILTERDYRDVRRFAGGLEEWQAAGYPVEGDLARTPDDTSAT